MQHSTPVPSCPRCGEKVYRTHTCKSTGLGTQSLPERGHVAPAARPLALVPMPEGWKDEQAQALNWPSRAQLHLVEDVDLDWGDQ